MNGNDGWKDGWMEKAFLKESLARDLEKKDYVHPLMIDGYGPSLKSPNEFLSCLASGNFQHKSFHLLSHERILERQKMHKKGP